MTVQLQIPVLREIAFCEGIHQEPHSPRFRILERFESLRFNDFPADLRFGVYFAIQSHLASHQIRVRLLDDESNEIFSATQKLRFDLPRTEGMQRVKAKAKRPGIYFCELSCDGVVLATTELPITRMARERRKIWFTMW